MKSAPDDLHFKRKLYIGLGLFLFGLIPIAYIAFSSILLVNHEHSIFSETYSRSLTVVNGLRFHQAHEEALSLRFAITKDMSLLSEIEQARKEVLVAIQKLEQIDADPAIRFRMLEIRELKQQLTDIAIPLIEMRKSGKTESVAHRLMEERVKRASRSFDKALDDLFQVELTHFTEARSRVGHSTQKLIRSLIFTLVLTGLTFLLLGLLLVRLAQAKSRHEVMREKLYEESERLAQARREILETVSHDLKNPLTAIDLNLKLLRRKQSTPAPEKLVNGAVRAVETMRALIEELLDQARLEAGKFEINGKPANLQTVIESVTDVLEPLAEEKEIVIVTKTEEKDLNLFCDSKKMIQVISNVLGNAIKFTPRAGSIEIVTTRIPGQMCIAIRDNGTGMSEEQTKHVFERFWQAEDAKEKGTGLGLFIAKSIVDAHHGQISVESKLGHGTTFYIFLPSIN